MRRSLPYFSVSNDPAGSETSTSERSTEVNLNAIKNAVTSTAGRQVLKLQGTSPNLMFGAGVVGVLGTVVLASRATLRLEEVYDQADELKGAAVRALETDGYNESDQKHDHRVIKVRTAVSLVRLYAPAALCGTVSIGLLTGAHLTLNRRNAGLVAAYAAVDKAFKQYRQRVVADIGPDKDREYRFGSVEREVYSEGENGEPIVGRVKSFDPEAGPSMYARLFDSTNPNWNPTGEYNLFYIKAQQNYLNNLLQARGHVFLNEAYDALGLDRSSAGQVVGWLKKGGDGFIDFGVWDDNTMERLHSFVVGLEDTLLLDFNVDGPMHDRI